jgi:hypothetical protein
VPAGTTVERLVDEFVATLYQHGIVIDRRSVEQEMHERIADIAERLGTCPETVLSEHARPGWGRQMASGVVCQIRDERLLVAAGPPADPQAPAAG